MFDSFRESCIIKGSLENLQHITTLKYFHFYDIIIQLDTVFLMTRKRDCDQRIPERLHKNAREW